MFSRVFSTPSGNSKYCSLGAYQPPAPPVWELVQYSLHRPIASRISRIYFRQNKSTFRKKIEKKKFMTSQKKNFFFSFSLFPVLGTIFARFENFSPIWLCWIFTFFVPRNNSESWRPKTKSCIPGWPDGQPNDERANFDLLAAKMAEIWSSDGFRALPAPKVNCEN